MHYRVATVNDTRLYFDWANDPDTRRQSFNSAPIGWEQHKVWFARKLTDPDALLLVFETVDGVPVGQVRFEKQADSDVIIGVSVDTAFRGRGLAAELIREACTVCRKKWNNPAPGHNRQNVLISAYIKPENVASIRAFEKAGFANSHESRKFGVESVCLTLN